VVALLVARVADHGQVLFWFAVCTFFFVSAFGLFVKVTTAVQTLGGQIGVGTRLLLNILDLAYVVVSLVAMLPKMVRPAM
jgi:hypothetical protein